MTTETLIIPLWVDICAIGIASMQGAIFASEFRDRRIDLLGVVLIGVATGFGGGVLRDILLNVPLAAMQTNWYVVTGVVTALFGMLLAQVISKLDPIITVLDALTIGLFGAIGTTKALNLGVPAAPAMFVGVIAAVGGGILRDMFVNMPVALMHVGSLYAAAAATGTVVLVLLIKLGVPMLLSAGISILVTSVIRLLAVVFRWSLPEQRALRTIPLPKLPQLIGIRRSRPEHTRDRTETGSIPLYRINKAEDHPK